MQYCVQFNCHVVLGPRNNDYSVPWIKHASCLFCRVKKGINLKALTVSTVVNDSQKHELLDI